MRSDLTGINSPLVRREGRLISAATESSLHSVITIYRLIFPSCSREGATKRRSKNTSGRLSVRLQSLLPSRLQSAPTYTAMLYTAMMYTARHVLVALVLVCHSTRK